MKKLVAFGYEDLLEQKEQTARKFMDLDFATCFTAHQYVQQVFLLDNQSIAEKMGNGDGLKHGWTESPAENWIGSGTNETQQY